MEYGLVINSISSKNRGLEEENLYYYRVIFETKKDLSQSRSSNFQILVLTPIGLVTILTLITLTIGTLRIFGSEEGIFRSIFTSLEFWKEGFFSLLAFTLQMMMVLTFGFSLAIFRPVNELLRKLSSKPVNLVQAVFLVSVVSQLAGLLNWGFGLITGALLARFVHEALVQKKQNSNPELLAACGYLGMAVWHGGLSASSLLSIAESNHGLENAIGVIPVTETIFSVQNLMITLGLVGVFCLTAILIGRKSSRFFHESSERPMASISKGKGDSLGFWLGILFLVVILFDLFLGDQKSFSSISLNWVIFLLFGLSLLLYRTWDNFLMATKEGLKSSLDIFVQFPFYGGIMGVILGTGLLIDLANWTASWANENTFPLFTFYSAALVNFFIPSGGGQWAVQGPLIIKTAEILELSFSKMALAFAYGDQISNLLQPFWALPLLSITGVSVRKLLPYCLIFFGVGIVFLSLMIWIFL